MRPLAIAAVLLTVLFVALSACGTADVIQTSPTTYSVSAQYGSLNGSWGRAKDEATAKATQFCKAKGQLVTPLDEQRSGVLGFTPQSSTITFACTQNPSVTAEAATAECSEKRKRGELKSLKATVECSNPKVYAAEKEAGDPNLDLLNVLLAARLIGAENVDRGRITEAEYQLIAELNARITAERRRRTLADAQASASLQASQTQSAAAQSEAALLQGLAALQSANRPPYSGGRMSVMRPSNFWFAYGPLRST
jgi:hypothetical protein